MKHILKVLVFIIVVVFIMNQSNDVVDEVITHLSSNTNLVQLYNMNYEDDIKVSRGSSVITDNKIIDYKYLKIIYNNHEYLVLKNYVSDDIVTEKEVYVRTPLVLYEDSTSSKIKSYIKKGETLNIIGYDYVDSFGNVNMYNVTYNDLSGYVLAKYVDIDYNNAIAYYDNGYYINHQSRGNTLGGGDAQTLDYYPYEKPSFEDNVMPSEVRSLYINREAIKKIDDYIALAKDTNINAFVVDIKDNTLPSYKSEVMKDLSPTNYERADMSIFEYKQVIEKIKNNGFYVIGRITVFKDDYYASDNIDDVIYDTRTSAPYLHNGSYWPSAYSRNVWYFNVELAKEAVTLMGFNEIQFDYVRFPDRTVSVEDFLDYKNIYNETKAQAIQGFVYYACDEIHKLNAYVSIDVFAESAHAYVTSYGQYFPAISNVCDVISAMPYPDHFNQNQYGFSVPVWSIPYDLLKYWGENYVLKRQEETTTPAIVRTWIQAYDTIHKPYITYDDEMVSDEIKGLYDAGLTGGYITWNSSSSLVKYESLKETFKRDYKE